jgi:chromatin remodeling complex protein RSC6
MDDQVAVQELILERFDHAQNISSAPIPTTEASPKPVPAAAPTTNGHAIKTASKVKRESTPSATTSSPSISTPSASVPKSESDSDSEVISPPKKKRKANKEVDDAKLAAMLQAQENSRARSTRGGGNKKVNKVAKKPRKKREKSAKKIKADDDSEVELGSDGEVKQKEKKGGFHKQYHLSAPLAELVHAPTVCSVVISLFYPNLIIAFLLLCQ